MSVAIEELTAKARARQSLPPPEERRRIRLAAGVTLRDVAAAAGVTYTTVFYWEAGEYEPRGSNLLTYLEVLEALRVAVAEGGPP